MFWIGLITGGFLVFVGGTVFLYTILKDMWR